MKASRVSLYAMIMPVLQFSFVLFLVTGAIAHFLAPHANYAFKAQLFNMVKSRAMVGLEQGVFSSTFDGTVIYVDRINSLDDMQGLFISDERSQQEPYAITASKGSLITNPENFNVTLVMDHGSVHVQPRQEGTYTFMSFDTGRLFLDINRASLRSSGDEGRDVSEMDSLALMKQIRSAKAAGTPAQQQEIEFQKRMSVSYACLIFGLIGAPLGIRRNRTGKSAGVAIAIAVILLYYVVLGTASNLARSGALSPLAATWIPNGILTAVAIAMVVKKGNEIYFGIGTRIGEVLTGIIARFRRKKGN
jgi:lipopolysaccharide export system permease protein